MKRQSAMLSGQRIVIMVNKAYFTIQPHTFYSGPVFRGLIYRPPEKRTLTSMSANPGWFGDRWALVESPVCPHSPFAATPWKCNNYNSVK